MRTLIVGLMVLAAAGCAAPPSSDWDEQATASLKAEVEGMLKSIDGGDFSAMTAKMDPDVVVFDTDEKNQPVRASGLAEVKQYMGGMEGGAKALGLKFASTIKSNVCHATAVMGYCAIEFDQTITAGGQTQGPFKFRGSFVARRVAGAWRWVHWHGGFAELPKGA
jgi:ketosteroid isomerase-like protein